MRSSTDSTPTFVGWTLRQAACWLAFGEASDSDPIIQAAIQTPLPVPIAEEDLPRTAQPLLASDLLPTDDPVTTAEMKAALDAMRDLQLAGQDGKLAFVGRRPIDGPWCEIPPLEIRDALLDFLENNVTALDQKKWHDVQVDRDRVIELQPGQTTESTVIDGERPQTAELGVRESKSEAATKHPGGRPPKYDRNSFIQELVRLANTPDGLPDRPILFSHMADWCSKTWNKIPADSTIRAWISNIYPPNEN